MYSGTRVSVVIPTWNSAAHIHETIQSVASLSKHYEWLQIVIIDDGSQDTTLTAVQTALAEQPSVSHTVVELAKNVGQSAATSIGFNHARGDVIVSLDDDLQYPVEEIPKLIDALTDDLDFVVGAPQTYANSGTRRIASRLVRWLGNRAFGTPQGFIFSPFVAYQMHFLARLDLRTQPIDRIGWMYSHTERYRNVPVTMTGGLRAPSNYRLSHLLRVAKPALSPMTMVLARVSRLFAVLVAVIGLALSARYLYLSVFDQLLPGFPTVAVLLLLNIAFSAITFSLVLSSRARSIESQQTKVFLAERRVYHYQVDGGI